MQQKTLNNISIDSNNLVIEANREDVKEVKKIHIIAVSDIVVITKDAPEKWKPLLWLLKRDLNPRPATAG